MARKETVRDILEAEIERITDPSVLARVRDLLVEPTPVNRGWDYGSPGETFTCWTVLAHPESNTGIAYCEQGFGPSNPWGLVFLSGPHAGIGMDSGWYDTLEAAVRNSMAWEEQ